MDYNLKSNLQKKLKKFKFKGVKMCKNLYT